MEQLINSEISAFEQMEIMIQSAVNTNDPKAVDMYHKFKNCIETQQIIKKFKNMDIRQLTKVTQYLEKKEEQLTESLNEYGLHFTPT